MPPSHPIGKRSVATRPGKPTLVKKTAIDRFNDSRQDENRRLNLKRKMEHDEKMASIRLKRHKYDLRYGSTPQTSAGYSTPVIATTAMTGTQAAATKEDKQIEILRLQIRLAELTRDNSHASSCTSSSQMPHVSSSHASSSKMQHNSLEEESTPSSGMSTLSYLSHGDRTHNGYVNNFISEDSGRYHAPDGDASDVGAWPDTYNFVA